MQIAACLFDCGAKFVELRHLLVVRVLRSVYSLTFGEVLRRSYAIFSAYVAAFHYLGKEREHFFTCCYTRIFCVRS